MTSTCLTLVDLSHHDRLVGSWTVEVGDLDEASWWECGGGERGVIMVMVVYWLCGAGDGGVVVV